MGSILGRFFGGKDEGKFIPVERHIHCFGVPTHIGRFRVPELCEHGEVSLWMEKGVSTMECHICGDTGYFIEGGLNIYHEMLSKKQVEMMIKIDNP